MKLEQIESPEKSINHIKSIEIGGGGNKKNKQAPFPKTDAGKKFFFFQKVHKKTKLDKLIRNAHYVTKEAKLLTDFV